MVRQVLAKKKCHNSDCCSELWNSGRNGGWLNAPARRSTFSSAIKERFMLNLFWWIRQIVLILIGAFFLYYGIQLLIGAYDLKDPFIFIMTFFASNFIILISGTLVFGFAYRIVMALRQSKKADTEQSHNSRGDD